MEGDIDMGDEIFWLGAGIALAGYFIGNGLKNFKNPQSSAFEAFFNEEDEHELVKENDLHLFIGISKEDAKALLQAYPDIPHLTVNGKTYYPKGQLREWLLHHKF